MRGRPGDGSTTRIVAESRRPTASTSGSAETSTFATRPISSVARAARPATVHVTVLKGDNDHHKAEAAFKALALALKQAVMRDGTDRIPSTKEVL